MPSKRVSLKGKGADLFFGGTPAEDERVLPQPHESVEDPTAALDSTDPADTGAETPPPLPATPRRSRRRTAAEGSVGVPRDMSPVDQTTSSSTPDSYPASSDAEVIESIRKVVKGTGREVSFTRLSPAEKGRLADIVYTYKRQGVKTSENEINRIAINLLLADYDTNGEESVLARVLAALQA